MVFVRQNSFFFSVKKHTYFEGASFCVCYVVGMFFRCSKKSTIQSAAAAGRNDIYPSHVCESVAGRWLNVAMNTRLNRALGPMIFGISGSI